MLDSVLPLPNSNDDDPFSKYNTPASPILFPVGERRVGWESRDGSFQRTNSHKAIIRLNQKGDAAQLLNIVGNGYKLVHNRELFARVEDAMKNEMLPEHLHDVRVTDRVAGWGKVCYREYVFPSIRCRLPGARSDIAFRIVVQNGYGGSALRMHSGAIDFYCTNGMIRGEYSTAYRKHTRGLEVGDLASNVKNALQEYVTAQVEWTDWSKRRVSNDAVMKLFDKVSTSNKMRENLIDQYTREKDERGSTAWAVYSTLTFYASHSDGAFALRSSVEEADNVASTMLTRELNVAKWVHGKEWYEMLAAQL